MSKKESKKKQETSAALTDTLLAFTQEEEGQTAMSETDKVIEAPEEQTPDEVEVAQAPVEELVESGKGRLDSMTTTVVQTLGENRLTKGVKDVYQGVKARVSGRKREALSLQFKSWAVALVGETEFTYDLPEAAKAFVAWLEGLSEEEAERFSEKVADFCADLDLELRWLVDPALDRDFEIRAAIEKIVLLYCLAHWQAVQAKDDIQAFVTLKGWQEDPYGKDNQALTQKLFSKVVEHELVSAPPAELFIAPEEKRQEYIVQAIQEAMDKDKAAFNDILKEL